MLDIYIIFVAWINVLVFIIYDLNSISIRNNLIEKNKFSLIFLLSFSLILFLSFSDLCAGLIGGLGVTPSGNIGKGGAVFESVSMPCGCQLVSISNRKYMWLEKWEYVFKI